MHAEMGIVSRKLIHQAPAALPSIACCARRDPRELQTIQLCQMFDTRREGKFQKSCQIRETRNADTTKPSERPRESSFVCKSAHKREAAATNRLRSPTTTGAYDWPFERPVIMSRQRLPPASAHSNVTVSSLCSCLWV